MAFLLREEICMLNFLKVFAVRVRQHVPEPCLYLYRKHLKGRPLYGLSQCVFHQSLVCHSALLLKLYRSQRFRSTYDTPVN